jgi:hypothetical protein
MPVVNPARANWALDFIHLMPSKMLTAILALVAINADTKV